MPVKAVKPFAGSIINQPINQVFYRCVVQDFKNNHRWDKVALTVAFPDLVLQLV